MSERITYEEFLHRLKAQDVPREDLAFKCPVCGTVQSMRSLTLAGATPDSVERSIGFSCVGRWTNAGPHRQGNPPGRGCDWTLGGLLHLHNLEVDRDGEIHMRFDVATPEEAKQLMERHAGGGGKEAAHV